MRLVSISSLWEIKKATREKNRNQWHSWFAWKPIIFTAFEAPPEVRDKWIWLEEVERKMIPSHGHISSYWHYRPAEDFTGKK